MIQLFSEDRKPSEILRKRNCAEELDSSIPDLNHQRIVSESSAVELAGDQSLPFNQTDYHPFQILDEND